MLHQWRQEREAFHASLISYHARLGNVKNVSAGISERQALSNLIRFSRSRDPIIKYDSLSTLISRVDVSASLAGIEHRDVPLLPIISGWEWVLAGQSRWQKFIRPNIDIAIKKYPGHTFTIDSSLVARQQNWDLFTKGYTNKAKSEMKFLEFFSGQAYTNMVCALHEMVHWVSHPPEQGRDITAWGILGGGGLLEGLTQVVTEDIMDDQKISPYRSPIYPERVAIARKLIERFGIEPFGEALFRGSYQALQSLLDTYQQGFNQIRTLANADNSRKAIECIDNLNRAFDARQKKGAASHTR